MGHPPRSDRAGGFVSQRRTAPTLHRGTPARTQTADRPARRIRRDALQAVPAVTLQRLQPGAPFGFVRARCGRDVRLRTGARLRPSRHACQLHGDASRRLRALRIVRHSSPRARWPMPQRAADPGPAHPGILPRMSLPEGHRPGETCQRASYGRIRLAARNGARHAADAPTSLRRLRPAASRAQRSPVGTPAQAPRLSADGTVRPRPALGARRRGGRVQQQRMALEDQPGSARLSQVERALHERVDGLRRDRRAHQERGGHGRARRRNRAKARRAHPEARSGRTVAHTAGDAQDGARPSNRTGIDRAS